MPSNPSQPSRRRARTPKGKFQGDDPTTPEVNEAWVEVVDSAPDSAPEAIEATPIRKPAGKPSVRKRVAKPKIGATEKVTKPTFGVVRGVYN
jgi:hypothetical protein